MLEQVCTYSKRSGDPFHSTLPSHSRKRLVPALPRLGHSTGTSPDESTRPYLFSVRKDAPGDMG